MSVKRLGRGLEALIRPEPETKKKAAPKKKGKPGVSAIPLKDIFSNPNQPRRDFDTDALQELMASIKEKGIITPVTVRKIPKGFELVAGERRWRAAKKLRLKSIPAYIITVTDAAEVMELALIENIQREDLNSLEEAEGYAVLNSQHNLSHEAIAKAVGKKRVTVSNALRLLKLPPEIRTSLRNRDISAGHGRAILQAKTNHAMMQLWQKILRDNLSVRAVEFLVKDSASKKQTSTKKKKVSPQIRALENQLISILGTKVKVKPKKKGGSIEIIYFSKDDLERLLDLINTLD
ncbi:MAG: ParB/RepB/Spo0J family partition protein [Candidatus Marinimicrobia bacterium]|mgnify:FL=1|nr:ParB/RepB/Spo0J family partition protein [Candidatus Neomarinimicrobiota bacterium]MBT3731679.1 ParB/RepB/Spo0J family partition protein [Candidatus Neomarinimicrobiota bacterium]MBT4178323.1 ParB/RepB/Spo0J family partition protein [Candidatus Neomarinimicrobiota bacterium]MBT4990129.1 ParB/RepB/Spo0J family partition protein [Candidatus Neomarinimicrobiota bacterium]MBT5355755.1 ParB/RepB/Spo0J family partition protein [Candidatus Neomarinimicrobiota bacterium]